MGLIQAILHLYPVKFYPFSLVILETILTRCPQFIFIKLIYAIRS